MKLDVPAAQPGERRNEAGFRAPARGELAASRGSAAAPSAMATAFAKVQPRK